MYLVFVKENGKHTLIGIAESIQEVKGIIHKKNIQSKIDTGKAYLVEGTITLIRPETTPELLEKKEVPEKKDIYY